MADPRPCRDCGVPTRAGPRCNPCRHAGADQLAPAALPVPPATVARLVAEHLDRHGRVCPGSIRRGLHRVAGAEDLTAVREVAGAPAHPSNVTVLCRGCVP